MELEKVFEKWESKTGKRIGKMYKNNIHRFVTCLNIDLSKASSQDILTYIGLLRDQGMSIRNVKNHLCAIKFYYRCLLGLELSKTDPSRGLHLRDKVDKTIDTVRLYSEEQIEQLLERSFEGSLKPIRVRNKILVQLLVYQGLKTSELVSLKVVDVDLEKCELCIVGSRVLKLESEQIMALYSYINHTRPILQSGRSSDILLLSRSGKALPSETISGVINYKAVTKFIPRKVRQSVIYHLLKRGEDLRKVQLFAGHRYISSTEAYLSNDLTAIKQAIAKHHPLQRIQNRNVK